LRESFKLFWDKIIAAKIRGGIAQMRGGIVKIRGGLRK